MIQNKCLHFYILTFCITFFYDFEFKARLDNYIRWSLSFKERVDVFLLTQISRWHA